MQKRLCGNNVDKDVEVMLSPSKLAAQRIYSTKRNSITFHAALQSGTPENAMATFEKPVQDTVPLIQQKATFPAVARESYPPLREASESTMCTLYSTAPSSVEQAPLCPSFYPTSHLSIPHDPMSLQYETTRTPQSEKMLQLLEDNKKQFKAVQQQIAMLRQSNQTQAPPPQSRPILMTVLPEKQMIVSPSPSMQTPMQPVIVAQTLQQPFAQENNSVWVLLQKLVFAAIFIVGLLRVVEWSVEKAADLIVPNSDSVVERRTRSSSRSSSFS